MTDQIPAEAVEAATRVLYDQATALQVGAWEAEDEGERNYWREQTRVILTAALPFLRPEPMTADADPALDEHRDTIAFLRENAEALGSRPEPSVTHRPGDEVDGTVYCSCGDGDYGAEGHSPESSEGEREALEARIADTLAYYECRRNNPKADHPRMGYHAFSEDQRAHLRAGHAEASAEVVRIILEAGFTRRPMPSRDDLIELLRSAEHAPMETHDPRDGSCTQCPWPIHTLPPESIADAVLALFKGGVR